MNTHVSSHSHTSHSHTKPVETVEPHKAEKEVKAPKVKLLEFDADRFTEELQAVVDDKATTPNNPSVRLVLAEIANALQRSRTPKATAPEKVEEEDEKESSRGKR